MSSDMSNALEKQVAQEAAEIAAAPPVLNTTIIGRCSFCGQLATNGSFIYGPVPIQGEQIVRFKGVCCGG